MIDSTLSSSYVLYKSPMHSSLRVQSVTSISDVGRVISVKLNKRLGYNSNYDAGS